MTVGTKSVLFGAHCFFLHPLFVAAAWTELYGFPWDPRLWFAFFLHDIGYIGRVNMDGPEGERHPEPGARIMGWLFDRSNCRNCGKRYHRAEDCRTSYWHNLCLYHSRYYAKAHGAPFSRLCVADKLCFALTPKWLYLPMVIATGEIKEYLKNATRADCHTSHFKADDYRGRLNEWHRELSKYMRQWAAEHKDGRQDTWTSATRDARTESGVWQ